MAKDLNGAYTFTKISSAAAFVSNDNDFSLPASAIRIDEKYPNPRHTILILAVNQMRIGNGRWVRNLKD